MSIPADLQYTTEHEWVEAAPDGEARCGVTAFAADSLGEVVFLDLPAVGQQITRGEACGEIESTKSVSELFAPATGTVTAINDAAIDSPEVVNSDPYGAGWLFRFQPSEPIQGTLAAADYETLVKQQEG